jgi:ribosomal protein S18 acetylase RimI-like enzyme
MIASSRRPHTFSTNQPPPRRRHASSETGHHLLIAYETDRAVGFVSGVEVTHPDKGTEMFLYELAVDEAFRRRGIGRALVERLAALARDAGCYGMWVVTDADNRAARSTYERTGGVPETEQVVEGWTF